MALLTRGVIVYIVIVLIAVGLWYFYTGGKIPEIIPGHGVTIATTTIRNGTTTATTVTTTTASSSTTTPTTTSTATTTIYETSCGNFTEYLSTVNSTISGRCGWVGGKLGVWVSSGRFGTSTITVRGLSDNITYVNDTVNYQCVTFLVNFTAPAQGYNITLKSGSQNNQSAICSYPIAKLNTTTTPPPVVYSTILNANFSTGQYTAWTVAGKGFGPAPLNITHANSANVLCYLGQPWKNYKGNFFATTFNCGTAVAPGNLTSSLFWANQSFLNFRLISPQDNFLYIEVLYNGVPYIVAHYNTYNISVATASSTFRNASIPLVTVYGKPVQIRIVADTLNPQNYIAAGDFSLGSRPMQDAGINANISFVH